MSKKRPTLLVFPSFHLHERPDLVGHPAVFVSYRFNGFLDDIYATFPVLLVIRNSVGEVRWKEIRDYLNRESDSGKRAVKQIVFEGERFDVMSIRRWRERLLGQPAR